MPNLLTDLPYITLRIEAFDARGGSSLGTGFIYSRDMGGGFHTILLVTNRHVIADAVRIDLNIHTTSDDIKPNRGKHQHCSILNAQQSCVYHPDQNVDLAAVALAPILSQIQSQGLKPFYRALSSSQIPSQVEAQDLIVIEEITMIGYPIGIWDQHNNMPLIRRGITATPYKLDYNGKKEFVIDAACFPGSSGSPVCIANTNTFSDKDGAIIMGSRFYLLGVLSSGPQHMANGKIQIVPVPTNPVPMVQSPIPTNLGYCIKAERVEELMTHACASMPGRPPSSAIS